MKFFLLLIVTIIVATGCVKKDTEKLGYYEVPLLDFIKKETTFNLDKGTALFVINSSSCSCKDTNIAFIKKIYNEKQTKNLVFVLKKDSNKINFNKIGFTANQNVFIDTTNTLEAHGNFFATDKVFLFNKHQLVKIFELVPEKFKNIKSELNKL